MPFWNTGSAARRSGIIALSAVAHWGGSPPSTVCTIRNATLTQLSTARPTLVSPAARKLKKGARSGVHIRIAYWLSSFSRHRTAVACGITDTSCSTALTRLCTPSARLMSASGYIRMSSGAASVLQRACPRCVPYRLSSRASSIVGNRSSTPRSGCRHSTPWQRKVANHVNSAPVRCVTSETSATAIFTTVSTSSISTGSSPCVTSALRNHVALFHRGSRPRRSRSAIWSGRSTTWFTYGPANRLYIFAAPVHVSGNSEYVTYSVEKRPNTTA